MRSRGLVVMMKTNMCKMSPRTIPPKCGTKIDLEGRKETQQ